MQRRRKVFVGVAVVVVVGLVAVAVVLLILRPRAFGPECVVPGDPANPVTAPEAELNAVQLQHASTINAVGLALGLPERARVIALATALQESSLRNRLDGDRDSVGLFQQRPSQGWGTVTELMDPVYSSGAFYDALGKVTGWQGMSLTDAAQTVQQSAFPDAYAKWEPEATTLARALGGSVDVELGCRAHAHASTANDPARPPIDGTENAAAELSELLAAADAELGGVSVQSVSENGKTAEVSISLPDLSPADAARALAAWTVSHATTRQVSEVAVGTQRWADHEWGTGPTVPPGRVRITVD